MTRKKGFKFICALAIVTLVFILYSAVSIWTFSQKLQLVETDAAVVLGAAVWGDQPSPVLRERIHHAIWLYENNYVDQIIFTGGKGKGGLAAESEVARDYALKNGVHVDHILVETKSRITEENLSYAYEIAKQKNFKTFAIVSDPLHMKRAMLMANRTGMDAYSSPTQSSVYQTLKSKGPFFLRELFFYLGYLFSLPFR
ncbi:multidrug MFS transporter [Ammoniphilus oxalaticus]|uniref:Multidrug MFS transporter n=1 Tax=Ammoniphilus oxalaticus TaxID=66863 RepID=A0A419SNZ8_9BACL|nr:YdcF family protein [Ammoniphilus oxalaticus]RKD26008.1 multidrug MFS transporter [Ammoniphilus oxalaticus]